MRQSPGRLVPLVFTSRAVRSFPRQLPGTLWGGRHRDLGSPAVDVHRHRLRGVVLVPDHLSVSVPPL